MTDQVKITAFETVGQDNRGITCKFNLPRKQDQYIYITRKAGSLSGNTYHTGKNSGTSPKLFLLVSGEIKLLYRIIGSNIVLSKLIDKPCIIEILPMTTHKVEAITDIVMFECNSIENIQSDRIKENVELN